MKCRLVWLVIMFISAMFLTKAFASEQARVGQLAPDFTADVYFPDQNQFGKISLSELTKKQGKWVVLFFYPADFTFA